MKISKKQHELILLIEKCGYLFRKEVDNKVFPESLIDALISKELISELDGKLLSTTVVG